MNPDLANYNGTGVTWNGSPDGVYREETTEVGSFPANPWGLYDLHGNVREWCSDWHVQYEGGDQTNPHRTQTFLHGFERIWRGGGWGNNPFSCRSAYRTGHSSDYRLGDIGFRACFCLD
jgi:formylglycine-generating enzyme required for sulfatase activity